MTVEQKKQLLADVNRAFDALCRVLRGGPKLRPLSPQFVDAYEHARAGLSIHMAQLEAEIGTDNL